MYLKGKMQDGEVLHQILYFTECTFNILCTPNVCSSKTYYWEVRLRSIPKGKGHKLTRWIINVFSKPNFAHSMNNSNIFNNVVVLNSTWYH